MNILVYGAGVLGSYLAHVLIRGGHDVTVLARGRRAEELEQNGIVIRHYFQLTTTVDPVRVIRSLAVEDRYDLIFVVMTYADFPAVLPALAANDSRHIVLVGNNADARTMLDRLQALSPAAKQVAFGFQLSGGRREQGRIVCVRGGGHMVLGGLDSPLPFRPLLEQAFAPTRYQLTFHPDIDAWLKNHIIPILSLNAALFVKNGQPQALAQDKQLLRQAVAAASEGFDVLEALGYTLTPAGQAKLFRKQKRLAYWLLRLYHRMPVAKRIDGSFEELAALLEAAGRWKRQANRSTPHWDTLEARLSAFRLPGKP